MSKDIEMLRKVDLDRLDTFELERFKGMLQRELDFRMKNPEELTKLYFFDDGCEGLYCPIDRLQDVDPNAFFEFVSETLKNDCTFSIKIIQTSKDGAKKVLARYGWFQDNENEDDE